MPLAAMQSCLTELYGLDLAYCVDDFLITDRTLAQILGGVQRPRDEELLIVEDEQGAEVSLFLEQALVERLEQDNPVDSLSHNNLADFLVAFEGVSHFTYFAFKASKDECVSRLELELQAEVDKFVAAALLLARQYPRLPPRLHEWLFSAPRLHDDLSDEEAERYNRANHYAARYCQRLWPSLVADASGDELRHELRRFYRLPRPQKIGHIEAG
ncbi:MAG: hypothetical protein R3305_03415 [Gammaproteobacteria bacterium]|nr:hypothetical protein [Gammaproteobacteria bacterium]